MTPCCCLFAARRMRARDDDDGFFARRRLPPFVAERPNPLSYLRRLRLRCRGCGRLEQASYELRCAAGPRPPARDSSRVLKEG
jgi:hypothetical protein